MEPAVKIKNVSVILGQSHKALKNVSLDLPTGKMIGFIGPSGAGKTTLIRSIVGNLKVTSGHINIFGEEAGSSSLRKQLSYMSQELSVYTDLTVVENLSYFITMSGLPKSEAGKTISEVLQLVDMTGKANNLVSDLSGGEKQRVSLAVSLIGLPKLLVLDEPTVGLDPVLREKLWNLFSILANQGITLIISSHSMDEASRCDDLILIRDGEVISHSSPSEFLVKTGSKTVEEGFIKLAGNKQ